MKVNKRIYFLILVLLFLPAGILFAADADEDGLSDDVELQMGSSPNHKDIFIEVDWLIVNGRNFRPRGNFIQMVTQFFASSYVNNPDGIQGIRAHVQLSQGIRTTNGIIGFEESDGGYNWDEFDSIKSQFFKPSRRSTHHYCLFVSDIGGVGGAPTGVSGMSRNQLTSNNDFSKGAGDFIVALGGPWFNYPNPGQYRWTQIGTFLHELGHNLGLMHGGFDHISFKPNNFSVMSYCYQTGGIPITAADGKRYYLYDYGRFVIIPGLDERALNEQTVLGSAARYQGNRYGARWFYDAGLNDFYETFDTTANVDWNQNGKIETNLELNLNPAFDNTLTKLRSTTSEWYFLSFTGGEIGKAGLQSKAVAPSKTYLKCLSFEESKKINAKSRLDLPRVTYSEISMKR